jgi:hypothetical protein
LRLTNGDGAFLGEWEYYGGGDVMKKLTWRVSLITVENNWIDDIIMIVTSRSFASKKC